MRRFLLFFFSIAIFLASLFFSCKKEPVQGVNVEPKRVFLEVGETVMLKATVIPENAANKNVRWSSNNPEIATVENGLVTAIAQGRTSIIVTTEDKGRIATCVVTVFGDEKIEMVWVEGGTFMMGCSDDECEPSYYDFYELPQHQVTLSSFSIGKYPVTQKQWVAIMDTNPSYYKGDDMPVHQVSWDDVQEFILKINMFTGKNYRLPTEAEWEYAARGGNLSKGYKYSGSDDIDEVAWHRGNSLLTTHSVGIKKPNELGIYDMSGNVREWCQDGKYYYNSNSQTNPQYPHITNARIVRGSDAFTTAKRRFRVSYREGWHHEFPGGVPATAFGFRLVVSE